MVDLPLSAIIHATIIPMIETPRIKLLNNALLAYSWRLKAMATNLANMDTPGYQRMRVSFEDTLQEVRHEIPGLRHTTEVRPKMRVDNTRPILEDELMNLADTQMRAQFSTKTLHDHFMMIQSGITGRNG